MIEQAKNERGLTEEFHKESLQRPTFHVTKAYPVRSSGSRFMRMAMHLRLPQALLGFVSLVSNSMRRRQFTGARQDYYDYCFVAVSNPS
jgi:hypothetical protein